MMGSCLKRFDGTQHTQRTVFFALRWFETNQNNDGSWGDKDKLSKTALTLLAFLKNRASPDSEQFGQSIKDACKYLFYNGTNTTSIYEYATVSYAMSVLYSRTKIPYAKDIAEYNLQKIIDSKLNLKDTDIELLYWITNAIHASEKAETSTVQIEPLKDRIADYILLKQDDTTNTIESISAEVLSLQNLQKTDTCIYSNKINYINTYVQSNNIENLKNISSQSLYFTTQAIFNQYANSADNTCWKKWNSLIQKFTQEQHINKNPSNRFKDNGYWPIDITTNNESTVYTTIMFTYIYETFFTYIQYLPVYPDNTNHRYKDTDCYKDEITIDIEL
jgi:hypothetical protein